MITISALYPDSEGCRFDIACYCNWHLPVVKNKPGDPRADGRPVVARDVSHPFLASVCVGRA